MYTVARGNVLSVSGDWCRTPDGLHMLHLANTWFQSKVPILKCEFVVDSDHLVLMNTSMENINTALDCKSEQNS